MTGTERRQNDKLDLFKCVSIYAVVLAHIPLPGQFGRAVCALAKFSVVLFFLASGFFSWGSSSGALGRRARRTGKLLLETCVLLLLFGCVMAVRRGETVAAYLDSRMDLFFLKEIVLYQVMPLPYAWPLWFLASLFIVYLLWWGMTRAAEGLGKKLPCHVLTALAVLLLAVHFWVSELRALRGLEPLRSMYVRNAWLDAFPFFMLGCWIREHQQAICARCRLRWLWTGVLLSALLALAEFSRIGVIDVFAGTTLLALLLMVIALCQPQVSSPLLRRTACFCGKNLTFYIFALHVPLYGIMQEWREQVALFAWLLEHPWLPPFLVAGLSTALALGLYQGSVWRKKRSRKDKKQ